MGAYDKSPFTKGLARARRREIEMRWIAALLLTVTALAASATERALDKDIVIKASLDQAWAAWTTKDGITSFFAPDAEIEPRVGGAFHIFINPYAAAGSKGADEMRYLALQPQKMLSFDWNAPPSLPEVRQQRTVVIVRFEAVDEKTTRVRIHHVGWGDGGEWDKAYAYFDKAWGTVLGNLQKRFDSGPVDWTEWLKQMQAMSAKKS